jgi:hypothetical protein
MNKFSKLQFNYKFYLSLGVIASILVGIGEYLLHFNPAGPAGEIDMLLNIPLKRGLAGHFFAIAGVPFYFAGYWGLLKLFRSSNELLAKLLFIFGTLSFSVGGVWISSRYLGAVILQKSHGTSDYEYFFAQYDEAYQILVWTLRVFIMFVSVLYILNILKNKIQMPKYLAIFNPIVILLAVFTTLVWARPIGVHIAPIAMNTTHFIFFLMLIFCTKNESKLNN